MAPLIVTGYVPLKVPRSENDYRRLGARLTALPGVKLYECGLEDCWMFKPANRYADTHGVADNPQKNTLGYHVVQHQKIAWLTRALDDAPHADPLIWVDYGVFHLPGMSETVIRGFMLRVANSALTQIALPGCWPTNIEVSTRVPCWRFCGTVAIVPRALVRAFDIGVRVVAMEQLIRERFATWEVNTWARLERLVPQVFHWYEANHDATLFRNFPTRT